ncbi:MAG: hypothetical protein PHV61_02675 [Limnochordia bacterium]|nr:hypothetical protein [Limnochordia bacterium]MDD2629063.1 hypothetical protein [Limnochordia bacterium]MDD4517008.1 hypothetical protein [Limnochordia bacterium]
MTRKPLTYGLLWSLILVLLAPLTLAQDALVNFSFQDADLLQVFKSLASIGKLNVITDRSVTGTVTVELSNIEVLDAIDLVARTTGYQYTIVGETLVIASPERLAEQFVSKEYHVLTPQYISLPDAKNLASLIIGSLEVEEIQGHIIVYASAEQMAILNKLMAELGQGQPQPSLNNASVEQTLKAIADKAGWTLFLVGQIEGSLTTDLSSIPPQKALELLAEFFQFAYTLEDHVLVVRPVQQDPASHRVISLNEISADKARQVVMSIYGEEIAVETLGERVIVLKGQASLVDLVANVLAELDQPRYQVLVEARIQEVTREDIAKLGLSWTLPNIEASNGGKPFALNIDWPNLEVALDALLSQGDSRLLAHPKIAAIDGEKARIFIGDRIPIILKTEVGDTVRETIDYFESGVLLEITPRISSEGTITLQVDTQVSSMTGSTTQGYPQTRTREAQTQVRVKDGQPLMIGGLIKDEQSQDDVGLPILSQLPLLGGLFQTKSSKSKQMEMLIFLVPHIVTDDKLDVVPEGEIAIPLLQPAEPDKTALLLDLGSLSKSNLDFRLERRTNPWVYSFLGCVGDLSWGIGAGVRRMYEPAWAELGLYYLTAGQETGYSVYTSSGLRFRSEGFILEGYWSYCLRNEPKIPAIPGKTEGTGVGFNVGVEF